MRIQKAKDFRMGQKHPQSLPLGNSGFQSIRRSGKIYVDKTALIAKMLDCGDRFFLSRPRRFGKSLLISTLECLFKHGLKDFEGLEISKVWKDKTYKVVHLDFSNFKSFNTLEDFERKLALHLETRFAEVGFLLKENSLDVTLAYLSSWLRQQEGNSLVLLIDEYDTPLTCCLNDPNLFEEVRKSLSDFYGMVKENDSYWRFVFITGITKFSKMSIFSGMNNLNDISLSRDYGELLGYTDEEIRHYFSDYVTRAEQVLGFKREELLSKLKRQYDGFCFDKGGMTRLYSPWSVLKFFASPIDGFDNYWYESGGSPSALKEYIKGHYFTNPENFINKKKIFIEQLSLSADAKSIDQLALLTQTGYLTIESVDGTILYLNYPNEEVKSSIARLYAESLLVGDAQTLPRTTEFRECVTKGAAQEIVHTFNKIILGTSFKFAAKVDEAHIQSLFGVCFSIAGFDPHLEKQNAIGASDLEVTLGRRHLVVEFKVARDGDSAEKLLRGAVQQLQLKKYGDDSFSEEVLKIALIYSVEAREFTHWAEVAVCDASF